MRADLPRIQIGQEMSLRSQKEQQKQYAYEATFCVVVGHPFVKTQFRGESLLGQEPEAAGVAEKQPGHGFARESMARYG